MDTINGCISRYPTRKPWKIPKTAPMSSMISTMGTAPIPFFIPTASSIQSIAISAPTEISIPPVSMTQVIPQVTHIRPALVINILRKV